MQPYCAMSFRDLERRDLEHGKMSTICDQCESEGNLWDVRVATVVVSTSSKQTG